MTLTNELQRERERGERERGPKADLKKSREETWALFVIATIHTFGLGCTVCPIIMTLWSENFAAVFLFLARSFLSFIYLFWFNFLGGAGME